MKYPNMLKKILPGIFVVGFTVGTGSVTAMSKAGADFGMALLWVVALSAVLSFAFYMLSTRFAMSTGKPILAAMKESWGKPLVYGLLVLFFFHMTSGCSGVAGLMAKSFNVWLSQMGFETPTWVWTLSFVVCVYLLFWTGRFSAFEKIMAVFVAVMMGCFFLVALLSPPPVIDILKGLSFSIPETTGNGKGIFVVLGGMMGTTVAIPMVLARSSQVLEKKWTENDLPWIKKDILTAVLLILVINILIMAAAAGTVYGSGGILKSVDEMIVIFSRFGPVASSLFLFGLLAAGFSSLLPASMMFCWLKNSAFHSFEPMSTPKHRLLVGATLACAFLINLLDVRPVPLMIVSQVNGTILMPLVVGFFIYAYNRNRLRLRFASRPAVNVALSVMLLFAFWVSFKTATGLKAFILEQVFY